MIMIRLCPNCLKEMICESIGWRCTGCRGFVDMQGNFHEHKEKPFMPPQTNADRIRDMSDEDLAKFIVDEMCLYCQTYRTEECYNKCVSAQIEWLKQPVEED